MECGKGVSFWLKPILHSTIGVESKNWGSIVTTPYEFCNRGYDCYDVALISYKHTYHPFYVANIWKDNNKCLICGEHFHHN